MKKIKGRYKHGIIVKMFRESNHPKLSQAELARRVGVTRTCINEIESGKSQLKLNLLEKILYVTEKDIIDFAKVAYQLKLFKNRISIRSESCK